MAYPGGKSGSGVYQKIINQMPPHRIYIEGFLGGGAILKYKRPAPIANIGIDIDAAAVDLFKDRSVSIPNLKLMSGIDVITWLFWSPEQFIQPDTLIYLDPPYLMETRSSQRPIYRYEMTDEQHESLLSVILKLPCMVMISGYYSDLYANYLQDWRAIQFQAQTRSGSPATEWLWMNFAVPTELHDYRFLGDDYRERERIKKRQNRWRDRLQRMDPKERYALLSVIQELHPAPADTTINAEPTRCELSSKTAINDGAAPVGSILSG